MQSHRFIEQHKIPFLLLRLSKEITALWLYNLKMPGVFTTSFSLKSRQSDWKKKWLQIICILCLELDGLSGWLKGFCFKKNFQPTSISLEFTNITKASLIPVCAVSEYSDWKLDKYCRWESSRDFLKHTFILKIPLFHISLLCIWAELWLRHPKSTICCHGKSQCFFRCWHYSSCLLDKRIIQPTNSRGADL